MMLRLSVPHTMGRGRPGGEVEAPGRRGRNEPVPGRIFVVRHESGTGVR